MNPAGQCAAISSTSSSSSSSTATSSSSEVDGSLVFLKYFLISSNVLASSVISFKFNVDKICNISFNGNYEKIKSNNIIILNLIDKDDIWNIVNNRLQ